MKAAALPCQAFERRVTQRARDFDLPALLRLLAAQGYARERTFLQSHPGSHSARSLVESVKFWSRHDIGSFSAPDAQSASDYVTITLNIGLWGGHGLLPSYFQGILETSPDPDRMLSFFRFFEHKLLDNYARAISPETDGLVFEDWGRTKRALLHALGTASMSTLHWLFHSLFPEFIVEVRRMAQPEHNQSFGARTGSSRLDGTAVVGHVFETVAPGFAVRLFAADEYHDHGERWYDLVRARLSRTLMPLLRPFRLPLQVELDLPHRTSAVISKTSAPTREGYSVLGYDRVLGEIPLDVRYPWRGDPERRATRIWESLVGPRQRIILFEGNTGDPTTDGMCDDRPPDDELVYSASERTRLSSKPRHDHLWR